MFWHAKGVKDFVPNGVMEDRFELCLRWLIELLLFGHRKFKTKNVATGSLEGCGTAILSVWRGSEISRVRQTACEDCARLTEHST
jgi:hypothetical protein